MRTQGTNTAAFGFLLGIFILVGALPLRAQGDGYLTNHNLKGEVPWGTYQYGEVDNINLGNGAVNLRIPLAARKGRGIDQFRTLIYSSKIWNVRPNWDNCMENTTVGPTDGITGDVNDPPLCPPLPEILSYSWWLTDIPAARTLGTLRGELTWTEDYYECNPYEGLTIFPTVRSNFLYRSPDGGSYQFPNRDYIPDPLNPDITCGALEQPENNFFKDFPIGQSDSGIMELDTSQEPYRVRMKNGMTILMDSGSPEEASVEEIRDTNGNFISRSTSGDTLQRLWLDSNGGDNSYQFIYDEGGRPYIKPDLPYKLCGTDVVQRGTGRLTVLNRIILPDGVQEFVFEYDTALTDPTNDPNAVHFGELTKVTLPSGGYIRYEYDTFPLANVVPRPDPSVYDSPGFDNPPDTEPFQCNYDSRRVVRRWVNANDGKGERLWEYAYARSGSGYETTVTDPEGNDTVHTFSSDGIHEGSVTVYKGSKANNVPVRHTQNSWGGSSGFESPLQTSQNGTVTKGDKSWSIISTTTTLMDVSPNLVAKTQTVYSPDYEFIVPGYIGTMHENRMDVVETHESGYGANAPGPLIRKAEFDYLHDSNSAYLDAHIWNRRTFQRVYNGGGALVAQSETRYDTSGRVTTMPGTLPQWQDPGTAPRGLATDQLVWRKTGGTWLQTKHWYDQAGSRIKTTDPQGHTTEFFYDDLWGGTATCNRAPNARGFVTRVKNALGQESTTAYYACTSIPESTTDPNSQTSSFLYDVFNRPTQITRPDGGQTVHLFNDYDNGATPEPNVVRQVKLDATQTAQVTFFYDQLLRTTRAELLDPDCTAGPAMVKTSYNARGLQDNVTNPHCTTTEETYGETNFEYDALGRVKKVIPPDGSAASNNVTTVYEGNCVTVTDQALKQRKSCSDGLGRLTDVWEDPAGLNYRTRYQYDVLDNLTKVEQYGDAANSSGYRTRTFEYNSLSQLLTATNPESGAVNYSYDNDGNLRTKTDARGITTSYGYDELHRLIVKSYSDSTVPVSYYYDGQAISGGVAAMPGTPGAGTVTIGGVLQSGSGEECYWDFSLNEEVCILTFFTDTGTVYITVNGFTKSVTFNQTKGSTSGSIAAELAAAFNADPASPVTSVAFGNDIQLTSKATGAASNYSLSAGSTWNAAAFPSPSFTATPFDSALIGGTDGPPAVAGCNLTLTINYPKGRRTGMCDETGATVWSYDVMGRVERHKQKIDGKLREYKYRYNEGGALLDTENVLGGGVRQIYDYNSAGRVKKFYDSTGTIFADGITYHPHGAMKQTAMGNLAGMIRQDWYNNRLQPCRLHVRLAAEAAPTDCIDLVNKGSVMEFSYDFDSDVAPGVQNNGNVGEMFDEFQGISYAYSYDALNRLKTADATGGASPWGLTYDYDAWGNFHNRGVTAGSALILDVTPNVKNQLVGESYDPAGNMLASPMGGEGLTYDAENRIVQVGANITYKYDGDGNRVQKIVSGTKTIYFRSAVEGNVRKEFVDSGAGYAVDRVYAYLNGEHLASYSPPLGGGWKYTFRDHLGTLRVRTRSWGAIVSRHDFYPFGGEHTPPSADEDHLFTDQERDAETGLDYFIARHYGNNIGRFLQTDPLLNSGKPDDPQSWNRYSYVGNNPLVYTDPFGLFKWKKKCKLDDDKCEADRQAFRDALAKLRESRDKLKKGTKARKRLEKILKRIGQEGKGGVRIAFGNAGGNNAWITAVGSTITFNIDSMSNTLHNFQRAGMGLDVKMGEFFASVIAHEPGHRSFSFLGLFDVNLRNQRFPRLLETDVWQGLGKDSPDGELWDNSWAVPDERVVERKKREGVQNYKNRYFPKKKTP